MRSILSWELLLTLLLGSFSEAVLSPIASSAPWKAGSLALNEPSRSFLAALASSSSEEIELHLQEQMEFSKAAVSRVVEVSDKIHRRTEELCQKIHARGKIWLACQHQVSLHLRQSLGKGATLKPQIVTTSRGKIGEWDLDIEAELDFQ